MVKRRSTWLTKFGILVLFIVAVIIMMSFWYTVTEDDSPRLLTTNIDLVHKRILADNEPIPGEETGIKGRILDNLRGIARVISTNVTAAVNMTSPDTKYIQIREGLRKEEIATILTKSLNWSDFEKKHFLALSTNSTTTKEGYFYPGTYALDTDSTSTEVAEAMTDRFYDEVTSRYSTSTSNIINIDTALKIASLIEREAAGRRDMRLISGVIWNRIFAGMSLDIDATLQYAKGTEKNGWWPQVYPADKYINSPYNTYKNKGLPPTAISNPSIAAIQAALNPQKTDCLFYLHDKNHNFHCSKTYDGQLANIATYYGK